MSGSVQQQFVTQNLPYAQQVSAQTGLPVSFVLGQAALESGWGQSNLAQTSNNYFGITNPGGTSSGFASYADPASGWNAYASLINSPRYAAVPGSSTDPYTLAQGLASAGYTPDANYASGVASTSSQVAGILSGMGIDPGIASGGSGMSAGQAWTAEGYGVGQSVPAAGGYSVPILNAGYSGSSPAGWATMGPDEGETALFQQVAPAVPAGSSGGLGVTLGINQGVASTIAQIEASIGNAFKSAAAAAFGTVGNLFGRGALIVVGAILLVVALVALVPREAKSKIVGAASRAV